MPEPTRVRDWRQCDDDDSGPWNRLLTKCQALAADASGRSGKRASRAVVVKVQVIAEILTFDGVRALPAFAVDGLLKACGRSLTQKPSRRSSVEWETNFRPRPSKGARER